MSLPGHVGGDKLHEGIRERIGRVLCRGLPASPGLAVGRSRVLMEKNQFAEFQEGEILVAVEVAPDWISVVKKAAAIVQDVGGMTVSAAIIGRELTIPTIVGTGSKGATTTDMIQSGDELIVDAVNGLVYERYRNYCPLIKDRCKENDWAWWSTIDSKCAIAAMVRVRYV